MSNYKLHITSYILPPKIEASSRGVSPSVLKLAFENGKSQITYYILPPKREAPPNIDPEPPNIDADEVFVELSPVLIGGEPPKKDALPKREGVGELPPNIEAPPKIDPPAAGAAVLAPGLAASQHTHLSKEEALFRV